MTWWQSIDPSYLVVDDLNVITDPGIRASFSLFVASMPRHD
jgi:hypothetical protein